MVRLSLQRSDDSRSGQQAKIYFLSRQRIFGFRLLEQRYLRFAPIKRPPTLPWAGTQQTLIHSRRAKSQFSRKERAKNGAPGRPDSWGLKQTLENINETNERSSMPCGCTATSIYGAVGLCADHAQPG